MAVSWSNLQVRPFTVEMATEVAGWQYPGAWSVYDLPSARPLFVDLADYCAIVSDQALVGFCCTGNAARVVGMTDDAAIVDVGFGMNPQFLGRGHGAAFGRSVVSHLASTRPGQPLRAVVQAWNQRSLRLLRRLGFDDVGELATVQRQRPVAYRIPMKVKCRCRFRGPAGSGCRRRAR
jgi:[ribosomal protein S18]-alanine N-acetyltransferase